MSRASEATLTLLRERGFARMSMEAVATVAGVGKPAIYRRFRDKAELVATVIEGRLPQLELPDLGDTRAELYFEPEAMLNREIVENAGTVVAITDGSSSARSACTDHRRGRSSTR